MEEVLEEVRFYYWSLHLIFEFKYFTMDLDCMVLLARFWVIVVQLVGLMVLRIKSK